MTKKPTFEFRAMAARHCKEIARLTYEAFPFEKDNDIASLGPEADLAEELKKTVGPWSGAVHLVALDKKGKKEKVVGFVAARWLKAEEGRVSTGVITMPRLVVDADYRGQGIGTQLLKKLVPYAAHNKYGEVMASIPDSLAGWYAGRGWTVSEPGDIYSLLEQPHMGDDRHLPEPPPAPLRGKFSPFHSQEPGPVEHGYTRVARYRTCASPTSFITSWTYAATEENPIKGLWAVLINDPALIAEVPLMTATILMAEMGKDQTVKQDELALFSMVLEKRFKELGTPLR